MTTSTGLVFVTVIWNGTSSCSAVACDDFANPEPAALLVFTTVKPNCGVGGVTVEVAELVTVFDGLLFSWAVTVTRSVTFPLVNVTG